MSQRSVSTQHQAGRFRVEGKHLTIFPRGEDKYSLLVLKAGFRPLVLILLSTHTNDQSGVLLCMKW